MRRPCFVMALVATAITTINCRDLSAGSQPRFVSLTNTVFVNDWLTEGLLMSVTVPKAASSEDPKPPAPNQTAKSGTTPVIKVQSDEECWNLPPKATIGSGQPLPSSAKAEAAPLPRKQVEMSFATSDGGTIHYLLYLPKDYKADGAAVPMMLFLHGRGESNGPLSVVATWGPPMMAAKGEDLPFILVSPQCPRDDSWQKPVQQQRIIELLKHIIDSYHVDKTRVSLTGLSMGGYGSWRLAADHPDLFSAVVPICGGGTPDDASKLKALPIWVFHGVDDPGVPVAKSIEMVDAIKAAGGDKIRFTTLEHVGHNCWSAAYATPELYTWMLKQTNVR